MRKNLWKKFPYLEGDAGSEEGICRVSALLCTGAKRRTSGKFWMEGDSGHCLAGSGKPYSKQSVGGLR